jgi:hypothetical protein
MWSEAFQRSLTIESASGGVLLQTSAALAHQIPLKTVAKTELVTSGRVKAQSKTEQALANAFLAGCKRKTYKKAHSALT